MKIAVYCGSTFGNDSAYEQAARRLGRWIAASGNELIYGGGDAGLMGALAEEAFRGGAHVTGIRPGNVPAIMSRPQPWCTKIVTTDDMNTRKQAMLTMADAFIALPGGMGTLDEISEVITLTKIGVFRKPAVLFNTSGFYEPFQVMVRGMVDAGFLKEDEMGHVIYSDDTEEIGRFLEKFGNSDTMSQRG